MMAAMAFRKTALLANNWLGGQVARWLAEQGDLEILVLHPAERRKHRELFEGICERTFTWPDGLDEIRSPRVECLASVMFGYIVPEEWLRAPTWAPINLHPALLPYNRGSNPNVWPLVDGTPAGTTIHVMTPGLDRGPILCQREVDVLPSDTAETLYRRLEVESLAMFTEEWNRLHGMVHKRQDDDKSTYHRAAELADLDPKTPDELALIDRLRARTFGPYGSEIERDGRRYRVRVEIEELTDQGL